MLPVLLAVTGAPWESEFVERLGRAGSRADHAGLVVVRRCVDVADLLATAATGTARAALVWPGLHRLDGPTVADLVSAGVAVVGIVAPAEEDAARALRGAGMSDVVEANAPVDRLAVVITGAVARTSVGGGSADTPRTAEPGMAARGLAETAKQDATGHSDGERGTIIAVWGPAGAPGRTTVAVTIAGELARLGVPTMLADADVYGGTVAEVLGIVDEAPGLAAAVRFASARGLGPADLAAVARQAEPNLRVLTGLARADRWPELRPRALTGVWERCRELAAATVVDCGFCLEQDEELSFDVSAPRRNGATLATLEAADIVCAVVSADPIGIVRLVRAVDALRAVTPAASVHIVVNRLRKGSVGRAPERQLAEVIERHTGLRPVAFVPYDRAALDAAVVGGRMLAEAAPGSPARIALHTLAKSLIGLPASDRGRRHRAFPRHGRMLRRNRRAG